MDNPVLVKEFRTRMRGTRAYWMLLAYTLLLAGILAIMYFFHEASVASQVLSGYPSASAARDLGRNMYWTVFVGQALMVALITPAITSGTVTIEREQRSYELLITTPLRPADLIRGKLAAAVSFVVLLLTASLPLVSMSFLVGGVSPGEIFFSYLIVALSAFFYGAVGIFWSATLRTTAAATVVTYLTVLSLFILTVVPGAISSAAGASAGGTGGAPEWPFQSLNPLMATFRAVQPEYLFEATLPSWVNAAVLNLLLGLLMANAAMGRLEHFEPPRPLWTRLYSTLLWCAFALFLFGPIMGGLARGWSAAGPVREHVAGLTLAILALACLVTPVLNTGDLIIRRGESALGRYLTGFLPHRMFANDLSAGFPLSMLWTLFFLALLPFGAAMMRKLQFFQPFDVFIPAAILCLSVVAGLAGIGHFLSVTLPSRWAACVLTYLAAVVLMLLPMFAYLWWGSMPVKPQGPGALWQVLYFVPFSALDELSGPSRFRTNHPQMLFSPVVPMWVITSLLYLGIGAACFLFTAARVHQQGKRLQQRMEAVEKTLQSATA